MPRPVSIAASALLAAYSGTSIPQPTAFDGTSLRIDTIDGMRLSGGPSAEVAFGASGAISATGGCNRLVGQAQIGPSTLRVSRPLAATRRACPALLEARDAAVADLLSRTTAVRRDGRQMVWLDAEGRIIASLTDV